MNSNLPSSQVALALLFDCGCSERVIAHCKAVSALAVKFASVCQSRGYPVDVDLVEVGALLHDIGRSKTHDVSHAVVGVEIAKSLNLPEPIVAIIEHHIGGGISADEAKEPQTGQHDRPAVAAGEEQGRVGQQDGRQT